MNNLLGNFSRAIGESFSDVATQTSAQSQRNEQLSKLNVKQKEINIKIEKNCTLIGQEVVNKVRKEEAISQELLISLFEPIKKLDIEKAEILEAIKQIKLQQAEQVKAEELIKTKKQVSEKLQKLQELKDLGVIDEDEYEVTQIKINKKVNNFDKLYNLKVAFERNLINEDEYMSRKAMLE